MHYTNLLIPNGMASVKKIKNQNPLVPVLILDVGSSGTETIPVTA